MLSDAASRVDSTGYKQRENPAALKLDTVGQRTDQCIRKVSNGKGGSPIEHSD